MMRSVMFSRMKVTKSKVEAVRGLGKQDYKEEADGGQHLGSVL